MAEQMRRSPEERLVALQQVAAKRQRALEEAGYRLVKAREALEKKTKSQTDAGTAIIGAALIKLSVSDEAARTMLARLIEGIEDKNKALVTALLPSSIEPILSVEPSPDDAPPAKPAVPKTTKKPAPEQRITNQPDLMPTVLGDDSHA